MKKFVVLLISYLLVSVPIYSECPKPVKELKEGEKAPCRGYLFSPEKELEVREKVQDKELLEKQVKMKEEVIEKLFEDIKKSDQIINKEREKTELWRKRAEDSTKKFIESEDNRGKRDFWMVVLGVVLTVGAGFAVGQAAK